MVHLLHRLYGVDAPGCSSLQQCSRAAVEQRTETAEFTSSVNELIQSVNATLLLPNFQVHRRLKVAW